MEMLRVVWINKSAWLKPGPIVYMGLLNAMAFARLNIATDYFVDSGAESDTTKDLTDYYGVEPSHFLSVHRVEEPKRGKRNVYRQALSTIEGYLKNGDQVLALTRELGALSRLLRIKKKYQDLKVVYESHDYYLTRAHLPNKKFSAIRRQWSERLLIPKADALICLTEYQRALYQQYWNHLPMTALSLGCLHFKRQDADLRRVRRHVAYIGHLHVYKGSELLFDIAKLLKGKNITLSCYGGHQNQVTELRLKTQQSKLNDVLKFETFISPAKLHRILDNEVSVGLVPLQNTFYSRYLTCPVKTLDFLSHGLPVVASDLPSTREVLQESGIYCPFDQADEFAKAIETLLDNGAVYQSASHSAYRRSEQLQWRMRAERILQMLGLS